jgi:glycosyltransferase involved in cell wall biosynthesis
MISPKIAVLMSIYNPEPGLQQTLDSLRRQTVPFQLYVVDDGSAPKPPYRSLLAGFDYDLTELPRNLGISRAVNRGLAKIMAAGHTLVARMDCGDIAFPDRLARQARFLCDNPDVGIVGTWGRFVVEERNWSYVYAPPTTDDALRRALRFGMPFINPSLMIRSAVYRDIGFYSDEFSVAEDYDFARRASKYGVKFANIGDVLFEKIENAGSISRRRRKRQLLNKLHIQWRYGEPSYPATIAGLLKTMALLCTPTWLADSMKVGLRGGDLHTVRGRGPATGGYAECKQMVGAAGFEPATPTPPE